MSLITVSLLSASEADASTPTRTRVQFSVSKMSLLRDVSWCFFGCRSPVDLLLFSRRRWEYFRASKRGSVKFLRPRCCFWALQNVAIPRHCTPRLLNRNDLRAVAAATFWNSVFQNSNFALINAISVTVISDQISGWPKQLLCLCAVMGSRQELFGLFLLTSEVSRAVISRKTLLNVSPFFSFFSSSFLFLISAYLFCSCEQAKVAVLGVFQSCVSIAAALWQSCFCSWAIGRVRLLLFTHWICCRL